MLKHYFLALIVTGITHFVLAVFVYLKGPRKLTNVTYACYSAAISWWSCWEAFSITVSTPGSALILWRVNHVGVIFIPIFFVHFVVSLLEDHERQRRRPLIVGSYAAGLALLALNATPLLINEIVPKFSFRHFINPGLLYPFFFLGWVAWAVYGLMLLYKVYARSTGALRNQLRYFCWSMLIAYIGGAPNFLPTFGIEIPGLMPFGTYAIPAYAFVTTYAIVRYRLMDVNIAITRVALFILVYVPLLILPVLLGQLFQPPLTTWSGSKWWIAPVVFEALFAVGGLVAYRYVRQRAEDAILAEQRQYQKLLAVAAEGMLKILNLKKLLRRIVAIMVKYVRLQYAAVYLQEDPGGPFRLQARCGNEVRMPETFAADDALIHYLAASEGPLVTEELKRTTQDGGTRKLARMGDQLARMKASVVVPAFLKDTQLLGFLVLGPKLSGQMFTSDDLRTFNALAHQAAIAIQNAHLHRHGVSVGQMATGHEQLAAWGHEMGNVLHIGVIQVGTLIAGLPESLGTLPREQLVNRLKGIEKALLRGHHVIEDVKAFLRCTEEPGLHTYPLAQFIEEAAKRLRERFADCPNIRVILDLPEGLPAAEGLTTLSLLPMNLLAIPFWGLAAYPAGGTITVQALTDAERRHVELVVRDDATEPLRKHTQENTTRYGEESLFPTRSKHGAFYYFAARKTVADHGGRLVVMDGAQGERGTTILVQVPIKYSPPKAAGEEEPLGDTA